MSSDAEAELVSNGRLWTGGILTGIVVLFLAVDGAAKLFQPAPVVEASEKLGLSSNATLGIGVVLIACTAVYSIPRTAVLGAILLTGYLGGAAAIHVRARSGAFPVAFSIAFAVLAWVGLVLREPRLFWTILLRR